MLNVDELRKYHTRPLRLNWGPENVRLEKRILGTQISMLGFFCWKFKELPGATYVLRFPLRYL